jgi:hypothetical protein
VDDVVVWTKRERKYLRPTRIRTLYIDRTLERICSLSADQEMIIRQAELYISVAIRPNYLVMPHPVNFRPNMRARFDLQPIDLGFMVERVAL